MANITSLLSTSPDAIGSSTTFYAAIAATVGVVGVTTAALFRKEKPAMDATEFQDFKLIEKEEISHDTRRFTFALQTPTTKLGLPVGQHITLKFKDKNGKNHQRSYTPVTGNETVGKVTFVIKVYRPLLPKFPEGGKMSQHLDSLNIGETMEMRGPKGHMTYLGQGKFTVKQMRKPLEERQAKHFGMIAGGTGITPMLQVIDAIFRDAKDTTTTISLLYANQTENDILVREELETFSKTHPTRFNLHYTLDRPPTTWGYSKGFINKEMVENHVLSGKSGADVQVLMCGPPPMLKFACLPALEELSIAEKQRFAF